MKFRSPGHRPVEADSAASASIEIATAKAARKFGPAGAFKGLRPVSWTPDGRLHEYEGQIGRANGTGWRGEPVRFTVTREG